MASYPIILISDVTHKSFQASRGRMPTSGAPGEFDPPERCVMCPGFRLTARLFYAL